MDKKTYKRYLQTEHWKKLRFEVLKRSGGRCERCGYRPWKRGVLQVHHKTYDNVGHIVLTQNQVSRHIYSIALNGICTG